MIRRTRSGSRETEWPTTVASPLSAPQQRAEDAEGGGLAGPVGPQQAEHLAGIDFEAEIVNGADLAEGLADVADFDHCSILEKGMFGRDRSSGGHPSALKPTLLAPLRAES